MMPRLAAAQLPEAVFGVGTERLRRFFFDLAIRGRLVEQLETDEPASELLRRIRDESSGGAATRRRGVASASAAPPYDIPASWCWVALGECVEGHLGGGTPSKTNSEYWDGDICWASVKDVGASKYIDRTVDRITEAGLSNSSANLIPAGHLIVVTRMGLGKVGINRVPLAINQDLRALRLSRLVSIDYCYLFLKAHNFEGTGMTVKGIRVDDLLSVPFPLPPFPEQVRIVARVDQLLALCEALEDADRRHHETRRCLVVSVSRRLAHPPATGPATLRADGRFYVENLGTLVRNAEDVEHLQDTLLALGVEGRLIEAHPAAQPVVERLASPIPLPTGYRRRRKIWKEGGLDLPGSLFPPLPSGWVYKTIEELYDLNVIIDFADGNHGSLYPRKTEFADHGVTFVTAKDIAEGRVMWQTCAKLREDRAAQLQKGWSRGGDVLLTHNATVGRVARVEDDAEPFLLGTSVTFYRLNEAFLLPQFFFYVLKSPLWQRQLEAVMQQTTRNQVSIQKQAQFRIPLAPVEDQERVVSRLDELLSVCRELEERLKTTARRLDRYAEATLLHLTAG